jgi:membrane protease YdiL (CAAX protease family)
MVNPTGMLRNHPSSSHQKIFWLLLTVLLLLRIPFTIAIIYFMPIDDERGAAIYEVGTYLLLALLIWWERGKLADFHIDRTALYFIIFLRPLQTLILAYWQVDSPLAFPKPHALIIWIIAIGLMIFIRPSRLPALTWGWLCFGVITGICISIAQNLRVFPSMLASSPSSAALLSASLNLLYHLGFAPVNEEPLFRGFLWGALRDQKWKDGWILIFQGVLFTSAHVYFASQYPFQFWVFIPAMGLLFGWLTLRSRSVTPSMLAHGLINGSVYLLIAGFMSLVS